MVALISSLPIYLPTFATLTPTMTPPDLPDIIEGQIDEAWEALSDFDFFNRFGCEIKTESLDGRVVNSRHPTSNGSPAAHTTLPFGSSTMRRWTLDQGLPAHMDPPGSP